MEHINSVAEIVTAIALLITAVASAGNLWISIRAAGRAEERGVRQEKKIDDVHDLTNSVAAELNRKVEEAALAKGRLQGRDEQKAYPGQTGRKDRRDD